MRQTLLLPLRFHTVVLVFAFVLLGIAALQLCPERAVAGGSTVTNVNLSASLHDSLLRLRVTGEVQPGAIYIFETAGAVSTNPPWSLLEPVQATNNSITYDLIRPSDQATAFFRVRLPQPTIFRVEPAIAPTTGGTDFFLIGQMLPPGGEVRIAGQTVTPDMIQEGTLYRCIAPALAEGVYDVEWLEGGQVVARLPRGFTVTAQPLPIAQRLAEPPTEPPASPEWGSINDLWTDLVNDCDVTPETPALYYKTRTKSNNANERVASGDYRTRTKSNNANERVAVGDLDGDGLLDAVGAGDLDFDTVRLLPATGEVEIQECDVLVPGVGLDFAFVRTYRSRSGRDTPMGRNWDHSYNLYIEAEGSHIAVCDGTGRRDVLFQQPDGSYARDEFFWRGRWDATNGNFILEFPGKGIWEFYHFGVHPAGGRIARIADANGNELQFTYNFAGRLTEITDTLGRTFTLSYNADGRLAQLADFTGRVWTYTYHTNGSPEGSAGDLARVTTPAVTNTPTGNDFPLGKTTRYTYTRGHPQPELNHNLETITDPKNQTWLRVTYHTNTSPTAPEFDTVAFLERGGHKTHLWRGSLAVHPSTRFAVVRAIVRDGVGNVCEFFCDSLNRPVIVREFTGRSNTNSPVTATGNRPTGKLRATDPDFYETAFEWNADSLLTRYIWPDGDEIRCAYERDFDPATNPRKKGDLRVWRFQPLAAGDLDADGITDDHTRVWRFEHDPRFGSPAYAFRAEAPDHAIKTKNANGSFRVAMPDHAIKTKNANGSFRVAMADHAIKTKNANGSFRVAMTEHTIKTKNADGSFRVAMPDHTIKTKNADGSFRVAMADHAIKTKNANGSFRVAMPDHTIKTKNADGSFRVAMADHAIKTKNPEGGFRVTRVTDPRGIVTAATYDARGNLTQVRCADPTSGITQFDCDYDSRGRLIRCIQPADAEGRRRQDAFSYYTNGPMAGYLATARYDNGGLNLTSTFEYDARGNLTRCITPRGHDMLWTYNALDQLVQAQSPPAGGGQRITTRLFYDANDNLVQVDRENRDATGALHPTNPWWTSFATFDALDRPVLICDEIAHSTFSGTTFLTNRLSWDANDNLARIEGPRAVSGEDPNQQTLLTYDERGLLHTLVEAPGTSVGCTNTFAYDKKRGKILRIENGKVEVENISNRHRQLPASHTNFMGSVWFFTYDRNDNLIRARFFGETNDVPGSANNIRLAETRWEYDALNRCVRQRDSFFDIFTGLPISDGESTHTFTYAPNGQLISETDDLGRTIRYTYDTAGRLTAITDPATNRIEFSYDANGNVTQVRQVDRSDLGGPEQVFLLNASYDPCDRLISETDNLGNALQFAYDSLDNVVRVTDPRGNDSCYEYDGLSRLLTARHFAGPCGGTLIASARCDYQDTRLVAFTDGNSNVTRYAYDSLDRCVAVTNADLTVHTVFFDGSGALRWVRDANGTVVSNTVDALNRVIRRDIFPGPTVAPTTTFETFVWDGRSFLMRASNNLSRCTFTWDSLGNCRAATQDGFALSQLSDSLGNSLSLTLPSGRVLGASYDALDRPTALTFQAGGAPTTLATLAYEGPDRLGRIARPNGIHTRLHWNGTLTPPNAPGDFGWQQVVRVNHQFAGGGTIIDQRAYAYDRSQNKTRRAQVAPFTPGGPLQTNLWVADALDRLVQSDTFRGNVWETTRTYQLDPNGNRQIVTENGVAQPYTLDPTLPEPADFQMNQYTTSPFGEYLYDPNGNRNAAQIAQGDFLFTYDYADRLVQVERLTGGVPETLFTYTYDALGRRLSRTFHPPTPLAPQTTTYIYHPDDHTVVEEWRDGALHRTHVVGRGREIRKTLPVAVRAEVSASGQVRHVLCDELGNALALTDAAGNVIERYDYDDSGQPRFLDPNGNPLLDGGGQPVSASPAGLDWLYRGAYWNATLGLHEAVAVGDCDLPEDFDPLNAAPLTGMKIEGGMPNRIMMNVSAGRQTSGATFGGRVILGLQQPDNAPPSDSVRGRTAHNVISHLKQMLVTPMRMSGGGRLLDEGEAGDNVGLLLRQNNNPPKPPPKPTTTKPKEFKGHITLLK